MREVSCVLKAGSVSADNAICEYFEPKPRLEQACIIPCPRDCVVSEFMPWTSCSKTCGTGLQNRVRRVLVPPMFGGTGCPNLTDFQTCKPGPCEGRDSVFSLRMGGWSNCSLPVSRPTRQARRRKGDRKERKGGGAGAVKDPETRELIKSKRNRNRMNRQESDLWDIQVGYQARQVICVHRNGSAVGLR